MKFSRKILLATAGAAACVVALRAELTKWAENAEAGSRLERVLFRTVSGSIAVRRPPKETVEELTKLIAASPNDFELYSTRALEAEQNLDFASAEADWKKCIEIAPDAGAARIPLADFYHRRLEPQKEFEALVLAAREAAPDSEKLLPVSQQRPWKTYERMFRLIDEARLDPELGVAQSIAWILRYPHERALHVRYFRYAVDHQLNYAATQAIAGYRQAFPGDEEFPVEARAELAAKTGSTAEAIAEYERSFRPLWPAPLVKQYFDLLKRTGGLRAYLERARAVNPPDLASTARLFYYWQQQNNPAAGERALIELRRGGTSLSPDDLLTLGRLFELAHNYDEAARAYYDSYKANPGEASLGALARLLFSAPEQPIHFGSGNLALYRNVATMDPHPGFLNGVLSLVLNGTDPATRYAIEEQSASAYFRRMRAAELVALFESKFPQSGDRAELRERVIEAYAVYGANDGVIRAGTKFLADFPNAQNRVSVALRMADAYARTNRTVEEFATYDALLAELGARSDHVPLGALTKPEQVRSPDYARVLDRYVARLVSLKRVPDALALYRREIDRNPKDPGLYDTLAAFLDQNKLGAEIEQVYQRAIAEFPDHTWEHKLARWYLRQRRQADVSRLTSGVIRIFSGTELDAYFREIVNQSAAPLGPALYLQLNLYAHQRFPHHLSFVRNLLNAYSRQATRDPAAYEALLRAHWMDAEDLRARFFENLSRSRRLDAELIAARSGDQNPAAQRVVAEGEAWGSHFETAAPPMLAVATSYPAEKTMGRRAAALERSLGSIDASIAVEEKLSRADPRDRGALTRLGEIEAEREKFDRAAQYWTRIEQIAPAKPDSYLEVATVFWDYYRYDDALRVIEQARQTLKDPTLFAYEAGAIRENQRSYDFAVREYAKGAIANPESNAERRFLALARRPELRADTDQLTANLVTDRNPHLGAYRLRVVLLRNQNRRDDLEKTLLAIAARATEPELLAAIENDARVDGMARAQQASLERQIAMTTDPVEKIRLRLGLARFFESQGEAAQGAQVVDAVYRENPAILGVVRAAVDYHWRNKNAKRAVDVLEESAGRAQAEYRRQFTLEAARKATESGDFTRARGFAAKLLAESPSNAEYIATMADTYARQGDDRGLRSFYEQKLREVRGPEQVASMRRALVPVLARMKDYSGAVDQYIEVVNRYPEDAALVREAAAFASKNGVAPRLRDFYTKAAADSPKDARWPMVLARIEAQLEDYPAAIAAYTRAASVRPDRVDLLEERIDLEMRLLRFDEAGATAEKLYELTYRNPVWMEKLAEIRARQGRGTDSIAALKKAWPGDPVRVLRLAVSWGLGNLAPVAKEPVDDETAARLRIATKFTPAVAKYYSPEEKFKLSPVPPAEMEARKAFEEEDKTKLIEIQRRRLAFDELGAQMERLNDFEEAARAYRSSGNRAAELRILQSHHDGALLERYCELLMPRAIVAAIARERSGSNGNAMVNYSIAHASAAVAQQAVAARGQSLGPVWTKAYTGLTGMYFGTNVRSSFTDILGDMTIGARLGVRTPLAGDVWFYYAGRFGEYAKSDDFLPAMVEASPGRAQSYFELAETTGSAEDYRHALELDPSRADAHDRLKEWREAIAALTEMTNRARVPQKFWADFEDMLRHIGAAHALPSLRGDLDKLLRLYIRRNGAFQIDGLIEALLEAGGDAAWIADLSKSAPDPVQFLSVLIEQPWLTEAQREILYRQIVESARAQVARSFGDQRANAQEQAWRWQSAWAEDLLKRRENRRAAELANDLPDRPEFLGLKLRVAARTGTLAERLAKYEGSLENLRPLMDLEPVRQFVYEREENLLGLAEIRLAHTDLAGAMVLLRRHALTSGAPFSGLDPAASLLEKTGHPTEAAEFLEQLVKTEPWNWGARERLASIRGSVADLGVIARSSDAMYATRVAAAREIRRLHGPALDRTEPELIAISTGVTDYEHPYWIAARQEAGTEKALQEAVAIDPEISKLPLLRAALAARHDAFAVAIASEMANFAEQPKERAALLRELGAAEQRLGDLRSAEASYATAQNLDPVDAGRRTLDAIRARIALDAKNEARRPVVSNNLEQDRLVHARLTR